MFFSPSLMCMDFLEIKHQMSVLNQQMNMFHVDIMDGHFCKNITLSPDFLGAITKVAELPIDVHLMVETPSDWVELVANAGADYISLHAETINRDAFRLFNQIKALGCKIGVAVNPATPLHDIYEYLDRVELLTIMTVDVGFAGQPFIPEMLKKIELAKEVKKSRNYSYKIQIDGSCNDITYRALKEAGAEILVVGTSGLFSKDHNIEKACTAMYQEYQEAIR